MFAVIFTAALDNVDDDYYKLANSLRNLATDFGCYDFVSSCDEEGNEITISYWQTLDQIHNWKNNKLHQQAQKLAKQYYQHYKVQITKIEREYQKS